MSTKTTGEGVINLKDKKRAFNINEVAEETTLSPEYVRILCRDGKLPATRIGKRWIILAEDLDTFLHRGVPQAK